jgi:hypothetical protein
MPPRIRSLLPRLPFAREKKAPAEAPRVFREFVETLQRLDMTAPGKGKDKGAVGPRSRARRRRYVGNGHKRPSPVRTRSRTR